MDKLMNLRDSLISAWRTNNRVTEFLIENLPDELWPQKVPGYPQKTVRMIAGHIHNARCMWIKTLGQKHGLAVPGGIDRRTVSRQSLLEALPRSSEVFVRLLELGLENGGRLAGFPLDLVHFLAYFMAHEGHHRGQICTIAQHLGHPLPNEVKWGLWQWSRRAKESRQQP